MNQAARVIEGRLVYADCMLTQLAKARMAQASADAAVFRYRYDSGTRILLKVNGKEFCASVTDVEYVASDSPVDLEFKAVEALVEQIRGSQSK